MENDSLISIAVPVFNSEKYLEKCLDSLIKQTYKNIEIVVLNNDSTDVSSEIIKKYSQSDSRIKCYTISHVPTETWSRNNAYMKTTGEWIIPVDSDDFLEPEYVEKMWKRHVETGAEWVGATMTRIDSNGQIYTQIPKKDFDFSQVLNGRDAIILTLPKWLINGNGALIRRNLIPCIISGDSKPLYNVEYDTRVILHKASKVAFVDAKYYFGYNPNSVGRKPSFTSITYALQACCGLLPFIKKNYLSSSKEVHEICKMCVSILLHSYRVYSASKSTFSDEECDKYNDMIREMRSYITFADISGIFVMRMVTYFAIGINVFLLKMFR